MMNSGRRGQIVGLLAVIMSLGFLAGCATPPEIKASSKKQLELIDSLDKAVQGLDRSLTKFHQEKQALIREEGLVLLARQAIDVVIKGKEGSATADEVFDASNKDVRPWLDNAFRIGDINSQIKKLEKRIEEVQDQDVKGALDNELQDLQLLKDRLESDKPQEVRDIEIRIEDDLKNEQATTKDVSRKLEILRLQIGLMKTMVKTVDDWLAIDVTVSQEQIEALKNQLSKATSVLRNQP